MPTPIRFRVRQSETTQQERAGNNNIATGSCSPASQVGPSVHEREAASDAERTLPNASASARGRSAEVGLCVGRIAFEFQNDVCGEESCKSGRGKQYLKVGALVECERDLTDQSGGTSERDRVWPTLVRG
jgi:hypothetical protein